MLVAAPVTIEHGVAVGMRATAGARRARARQKARYERGGRGIIEHEIARPREKVLDRTQFSDCIGDPCRWLKFLFFVLSTRFDSWKRSDNFVRAALPGHHLRFCCIHSRARYRISGCPPSKINLNPERCTCAAELFCVARAT